MLKLALIGVVVLILVIAFIIIIRNKPDLWFWIFLNLFFDPGGYIGEYMDGKLIGPLNVTDVLVVGMIMCLIFTSINWKVVFEDKFFSGFLLALIIFSAYYFIFYGGVVPYFHNDFDYPTFLLKNRIYAYGLIILICVYLFSLRSLKYFYSVTLATGVICLSLYMITLLTGLNLIPVLKLQREGTEMMRISMGGYGLFDVIFPLALITFLLSRKIKLNLKYINWLYYGGIVMIITQIITLTRRTQIDIIGTTIIIVLIIAYIFRTGQLSEMFKIIIPAILIIFVLFFTFPKYLGYVTEVAENTFLVITTGKDSEGESEYRVSGTAELEITKEYIRNNLLFGTGYTYLYWGPGYASSPRGDEFALAADAAGEVPIYYLLFGFGIIGAILMVPLYFILAKLFLKLIKLLRLTLMDYLQDPLIIIFSICILMTIATKFTIKLYSLSQDFTGGRFNLAALFIGIGFALYRKINLNFYLTDNKKFMI